MGYLSLYLSLSLSGKGKGVAFYIYCQSPCLSLSFGGVEGRVITLTLSEMLKDRGSIRLCVSPLCFSREG